MLTEAYPNPLNPFSTIRFGVITQSVQMDLYNMQGQLVKTLFKGVATGDEMYNVRINGSGLTSGIYLIQLPGNDFRDTRSVTLLK